MNNPRMLYRWRYLNQIVKDWDALQFDQVSVDSISYTTSNLVTTAEIPLSNGVGDVEYFFTAEIDAPYYSDRDYAFDNNSKVGYGLGWTEQIKAVTNRVVYNTAERTVPSGGTDYFVRIREGESNMEWVQLVGTLTITNVVGGSNDVYRFETPDKTVPRMTLVGDHSWRYHYQIPTNGVGGKLSFHLVTKEHYTNETDAATWLTRTNNLFTAEEFVTEIPYTATLNPGNTNEIAVVLDESSTHLKIEYNDEQRAFSLSHAAYQAFNQWTDAVKNFQGNVMSTNGDDVVSNSGVSEKKGRSDAPFNASWKLSPEEWQRYWSESFTKPVLVETDQFPTNEFAVVRKTPNGWTARNSSFVLGTRGAVSQFEEQDLAVALNGYGEGSVGLENFSEAELPLGLDTVSFTARIAQPIEYGDFVTYMDGLSCKDYAISAKITMSRMKETDTVKPSDMSPVYPTVSFVGYHRGKQGCYEFRLTRSSDTALKLELYKWKRSGSSTTPVLLASREDYTANLLVPKSDDEVRNNWRTAAYFLLSTIDDNKVKLEGHLSSVHTALGAGITGAETGLSASAITYVDTDPGVLANGGSYGLGSTDCRAGFGAIRVHTIITPPTETTDAVIGSGTLEGRAKLEAEWDYYTSRWEVDPQTSDINGGLSAVIPSNQVITVYLADASVSGGAWYPSGYDVVVNSFSTNKFEISPRLPGVWKVMLKTGEDEDSGVVVDDIEISPWEGEERWGRNGSSYQNLGNWVYTKSWIDAVANITYKGSKYYLPNDCVKSAGTNGYAFVFNRAGTYEFTPKADMVVDRILLVGGGGSGGAVMGGGGGGGGVVDHTPSEPLTIPAGTLVRFTVGAGGKAPTPTTNGSGASNQPAGNNGGDTLFSRGISGVPTAKGGGGGGGWSAGPKTGGCGGGGSNTQSGAAGTAGQGYAGGKANGGTGAGGGGAGGPGNNADPSPDTVNNTGKGGDGGAGKESDITGEIEYYGGGGGGGAGWRDTQRPGQGGAGGGGRGSEYRAKNAVAGKDGFGGGGGGGTWYGSNRADNRAANGGCGTVILRVRTSSRVCLLQPSRGKKGYPMGLRSPYIDEGMSLFSYSYKNADSNCVMLVQIATNMVPSQGAESYIPELTESIETSGDDQVWTTLERHEFKNLSTDELASGTRTTFISLRQHWIYDIGSRGYVYTNVCGAIRVIVDPDVVTRALSTFEKAPASGPIVKDAKARDAMIDYGKITITKAYCYNEPALNMRSWFGFNVHTEGWDGKGNAGRFAFLTDWPDGLSIALNYSAKDSDNRDPDALGIGLAESDPTEVEKYAQQNPFIQCAALTNGIGTVSFRARLFDTNKTSAVVTLYGSSDPSQDQPWTESQFWKPITNFVVTAKTYQPFEWSIRDSGGRFKAGDIKAVRLEAAGARWGRYPNGMGKPWEWGDLRNASQFGTSVVEQPINRVFIDEMSVSELIEPRLKFLDVRPFRSHLGTEAICVITDINSPNEQPLIGESWGLQCRIEPQQMADELDMGSVRVWMEVYRGETPWGYEQWKDLPKYMKINGQDVQQRFTSELERVSDSELVFRSYSTFPESIMPPEDAANTVYQYVVRATFRDKAGRDATDPPVLTARDWNSPTWYRGSKVGGGNASGDPSQFSAYTILDAISPRRAWINEVNICDAMNTMGLYQFIEFAVPQRADLKNWKVQFTDYQKQSASLFTFGIDDGVRNLTSKIGNEPPTPRDHTNHYAFVSVCAPQAKGNVKNDGTWKRNVQNLGDAAFQYYLPYGIQLIRPSGIIEHEIVVQGTNTGSNVSWGNTYSGTNLVAMLRDDDKTSQWIYAGEDKYDANTTLGVFRSHGEDTSCWTNFMKDTSTELNELKDGTLQDIPYGYFLEPFGTNVWIYSTILTPQYMSQFFGDRNMGANAVIVVPKDTPTNIVFQVTNWYQIGTCTINGEQVAGARGKTGRYTLDLGTVSNTITLLVGAEADDRLKNEWGLTPENRYTPAVLDWLLTEYGGYGIDDLSAVQYRDFKFKYLEDIPLTEMYWYNIPPVHKAPISGGSNIWLVAGMGTPDWAVRPGGTKYSDVEPYVAEFNGTFLSNIFVTVTMMITNTVTGEANPPDRLNGVVYDGEGSMNYTGQPAWTSVVFSITGALQKPDVSGNYLPLQQYAFRPDSFGAKDSDHPFQTRIDVRDPFASNSLGYYYGWPKYRFIYSVFNKFTIEDNPDRRLSISPLVPNWNPTPSSP